MLTTRGRRTRDSIVQTAASLMHRNGVRATSLDDVLARCGAGKSQLYHLFATKDELMQAVIAHQWQATRAAFDLDSHGPDTWGGIRHCDRHPGVSRRTGPVPATSGARRCLRPATRLRRPPRPSGAT